VPRFARRGGRLRGLVSLLWVPHPWVVRVGCLFRCARLILRSPLLARKSWTSGAFGRQQESRRIPLRLSLPPLSSRTQPCIFADGGEGSAFASVGAPPFGSKGGMPFPLHAARCALVVLRQNQRIALFPLRSGICARIGRSWSGDSLHFARRFLRRPYQSPRASPTAAAH